MDHFHLEKSMDEMRVQLHAVRKERDQLQASAEMLSHSQEPVETVQELREHICQLEQSLKTLALEKDRTLASDEEKLVLERDQLRHRVHCFEDAEKRQDPSEVLKPECSVVENTTMEDEDCLLAGRIDELEQHAAVVAVDVGRLKLHLQEENERSAHLAEQLRKMVVENETNSRLKIAVESELALALAKKEELYQDLQDSVDNCIQAQGDLMTTQNVLKKTKKTVVELQQALEKKDVQLLCFKNESKSQVCLFLSLYYY
uniref:Uncharacterized protein n=1 Tax=Eptatretus burgeri TaxID=7764 RepID=A0A8C4Q5G1_EPTBU